MECEFDRRPSRCAVSRVDRKNTWVEKPIYNFKHGMLVGFSRAIILAVDDMDIASVFSYALKGANIRNPIGLFKESDEVISFLTEQQWCDDTYTNNTPLLLALDTNLLPAAAIETLKAIRELPKYKKLLIVAITETGDWAEVRLAYEAGVNWHLSKSTDFTDIMRLVRRIREFWSYAVKPDFYEQLAAL